MSNILERKDVISIIIKKRQAPESILMLERGVKRISKRKREMEFELRNIEQGYLAECKLDFYLERMGMNSNDIIVLQDLRLPATDGHSFFQMDNLLLTTHFAVNIDVKSQPGKFTFQNNARNFQYYMHGKKYGMMHPLSQVDEQCDQLRFWLGAGWENYPIINLVALADPSAEIATDSSSDWVYDCVMPFALLKKSFKRAAEQYTQAFVQLSELTRIGYQLAQAHCKPELRYWKRFELVDGDVKGGVLCPFCNRLAMDRLRVIWDCPHCGGRDRRAHVMSILDHFVFVKPTMTNQECRKFLHVEKEHTARALMTNAGILDWNRGTKGRVYYLKK
ncbi:Nuclease-related domain-containing protein [Gracilibacillus orientalis]|uniref:Nuclease-related domain-containing protein n=1 Tax=Gracilibacillus orientalis TaxID=334253 RepID=A0A1I4PFF4_9BACI|nr:nuclease-related domain-containing protein [Gracilibacillus orientalis]SFM26478.1 Nuclease-related domain-containing protein [Gracilibacillus orientalis]